MAKRQRTDSAASSSTDQDSDTNGVTSKYVQFDESLQPKPVIRCALAPHPKSVPFYSLEEYDVHYAEVHSNRCSECHKNLPSSHLLALHISENHDPINEARRSRGEKTVRQTARVLV
jgi:nitrate reductase cytochrome c-type subunit